MIWRLKYSVSFAIYTREALDAAKNRFSRRKYREAIKAAKKFYEIKPNKKHHNHLSLFPGNRC